MKHLHLAETVILGVLLAASPAQPYSAGISGRSSAGCTCHSASANPDTSVVLSVPSTLSPGATVPVGVSITSAVPIGGINAGGFDLTSTGGKFTASPLVKTWSAIEVGHTTDGNDQRSWSVNWTHSPALCEVDFSVAGNAVNGNGVPDAGDHWNLATASARVDATGDSTPPAAPAFMQPAPGWAYVNGSPVQDNVSTIVVVGSLTIRIADSDNIGIDHVELTDAEAVSGSSKSLGNAAYTPSNKQFTLPWSPSPGVHTLTAKAVDCNGNSTTSSLQIFVL
jgi:hypothetical protein